MKHYIKRPLQVKLFYSSVNFANLEYLLQDLPKMGELEEYEASSWQLGNHIENTYHNIANRI